jgi:hypothetical protein
MHAVQQGDSDVMRMPAGQCLPSTTGVVQMVGLPMNSCVRDDQGLDHTRPPTQLSSILRNQQPQGTGWPFHCDGTLFLDKETMSL